MKRIEGEQVEKELMERAVAATATVVRALRPVDLGRRTPCEHFDVRALLDHLFWVLELSLAAASRRPASAVPDADVDRVGETWAQRFDELVSDVVDAWAAPGAWEGDTSLAGTGLPAVVAGGIVFGDIVIHGWDLARAVGADFRCDDEVAAVTLETMTRMAQQGREMGAFGSPVDVPDDASVLERALARSGRDPNWAHPPWRPSVDA